MGELNYKLLDELPRDLKIEIQKYLITKQMYLTSKKNWEKYIKIRVSSIIMSDLGLINYNTYNTYIRYLIRNKLDYVFKYVVKESKTKFGSFKKFIYKGKKWNDYIEFLKWYCRNQQSGKCLKELLRIYNC